VSDYRNAKSLGDRIQAARKARGVRSAQALADLVGNNTVSASTLHNIETGRLTNISLSQLLNIAFALKVAPSFLLAPLGRPNEVIDLPSLSPGLSAMTAAEFDAWLTGTNNGGYRATNAPEMAERNELAAFRDLDSLIRERARLRVVIDLDSETANSPSDSKPWDRTEDKLTLTNQKIDEITAYLRSAGWSLDGWAFTEG
jgi:transcriptional regulator with XRE-family HTH domain